MRLSKNFESKEFVCPCCGAIEMQPAFIGALQVARDYMGRPFIINSGYRCPIHNRAVGGVLASPHLGGWASDVHCNHSVFRYLLIGSLLQAGFNRIGIYKYFIHVDSDPSKPPGMIWAGSLQSPL